MSPKKNTGTGYELLTKAIFESLLKQDEVETVELKHDVTFKGKSTTHQIDVYWSFEHGGIIYHTVVQAKDWTSEVRQEQVLTFKSVLDDLPFRATGIMVTKTGYQSGAQSVAQGYGIHLYELREPTVEDTKIKAINIGLNLLFPKTSNLKIQIDQSWFDAEKGKLRVPNQTNILELNGDSKFVNEQGQEVGHLSQIPIQYIPKAPQFPDTKNFTHLFSAPTFVKTGITHFPILKISSISFDLGVEVDREETIFEAQLLVGFILKNTLNGSAKFFSPAKRPL